MTQATSPLTLVKRIFKLPNTLYALAPLLLLVALCQPIIQDRDLYFSFTHAYSGWLVTVILLPAFLCYLFGLPLRWSRIALICALVALIAMPFVEAFIDEERLKTIFRLFSDEVYYLSKQNNYKYFQRFEDNWQQFVGLAWLAIPAILFCILAIIAPKYNENQDRGLTLTDIKHAFSKHNLQSIKNQTLCGIQDNAKQSKQIVLEKVGNNEALTNLAKDKVSQLGSTSKAMIDKSLLTKENLQQTLSRQSPTLSIKQFLASSQLWVAAMALTTLFLGSLLFASNGPSSSEVERHTLAIVEELSWKINIHNLDIEQCQITTNETGYRCLVSAQLELYDPKDGRKRIESSMKMEPRTFLKRDDEWHITLDHVLSVDAQMTMGMLMIGEMFEGFKQR